MLGKGRVLGAIRVRRGFLKKGNMKMKREKKFLFFFKCDRNMERKRDRERICCAVMYAHAVEMVGVDRLCANRT